MATLEFVTKKKVAPPPEAAEAAELVRFAKELRRSLTGRMGGSHSSPKQTSKLH